MTTYISLSPCDISPCLYGCLMYLSNSALFSYYTLASLFGFWVPAGSFFTGCSKTIS
jgi:hypothetical protein